MGRNILRGTALAVALFGAVSSGLIGTELPHPPRQTVGAGQGMPHAPTPPPPQQNHAPNKAWTINPTTWAQRPEVTLWLDSWTSPEGREKFINSFQRYQNFRDAVDQIIRKSEMPWETSMIPVVESNWRIDAVSPSGAAGPWQFLLTSARGRGLIVDTWRDDRRDIWRSTKAAMEELAFGYRLFSDWLMAIAAYNAGPTRMRSLKSEGQFDGYWSMMDGGVLPQETQNYVPQVIAVAWIFAHSGRLGFPVEWPSPPKWTRLSPSQSVPLDTLISITGTNPELMEEAHSELQHPFTPPPGHSYSIKVLEDSAYLASAWLEQLEENAPLRFWRYTVRSGDTLSGIAQRNGISLTELLQYNGRVADTLLRIGERLYLPGGETAPPEAESDELPDWKGLYSVQPGDSMWSIAGKFGISPVSLAEANHRGLTGVLLAGSVLKVPQGK